MRDDDATADPPREMRAYLAALDAALRAAWPSAVVGGYLHGSAVLGGFRPGASDVDVLAVVAASADVATQRATGEALAAVPGCPGTGLEMSVITAATAGALGDCPFEVHVNTVGPAPVVVTGADHPGDPDLVLHSAVCRQHAHTVDGPPPDRVFAAVPRSRVLAALRAELEWALEHASGDYAVLNACRALRYAEDGTLCSKVDGARWWLARRPGDPVVIAADKEAPDVRRFVEDVLERLR